MYMQVRGLCTDKGRGETTPVEVKSEKTTNLAKIFVPARSRNVTTSPKTAERLWLRYVV